MFPGEGRVTCFTDHLRTCCRSRQNRDTPVIKFYGQTDSGFSENFLGCCWFTFHCWPFYRLHRLADWSNEYVRKICWPKMFAALAFTNRLPPNISLGLSTLFVLHCIAHRLILTWMNMLYMRDWEYKKMLASSYPCLLCVVLFKESQTIILFWWPDYVKYRDYIE